MITRDVMRKGGKKAATKKPETKIAGDRYMPTIKDNPRHMYPLTAPGMHIPDGDFLQMARDLGDTTTTIAGKAKNAQFTGVGEELRDLIHRALYSKGDFVYKCTVKKGKRQNLTVVTGHRWGGHVEGPVRSDVMIIGKMLGEEEVAKRRQFIGATGTLLFDAAAELQVPEHQSASWYVTNLVKTCHPLGPGNSTLQGKWKKDWLHVLDQELRLVKPKYILCLGADASAELLGKHATVSWMEGRIVEHTYPISRNDNGDIEYHTALVMTITHPAAVLHAPELEDRFKNGFARFVQLAVHHQRWDQEEEGLDHRVYRDVESIRDLAAEIKADCQENLIAVDAEWHGQHPINKGAYLRSFQISWRPKTAATIVLRGVGGAQIHSPEELKEIKQLMLEMCRGRQIAGHFLEADLEWLTPFGVDLRKGFEVPDSWPKYMQACLRGRPCGFDTGLAAHALVETDEFGLTYQTLRHTTAPRYDIKLTEWKKRYCKEKGLKDEELEGYGECPEEVLFGVRQPNGHYKTSYSGYDADVTRRLAVLRKKQLCKDAFGNNCWEGLWMSMRAFPAVLEINSNGVCIDRERVDRLTETYMTARGRLEQTIRDWARWPEFNINSVYQVREFLYGEELNGKEVPTGQRFVRLRPQGARSLRLMPIKTTDKRPMMWPDVLAQGLSGEKTPSTDKAALAILAQENQETIKVVNGKRVKFDFSKQVNWIRDYRFTSQVLRSSLRPPIVDAEYDEDSGEKLVYRKDPFGYYVYAGGIPAAVCSDGRVRTHIYPTKETRRWSSARPALQNLSKRREADYKRILGDDYKWPLRTIVCSAPGRVLVEADYVGAELFGMAVMSGDALMIEHASRNILPENDPRFYDIHSNVAVFAFRLKCEPTKAGLGAIGKSHLRIVAKSVIFGIAYGRGAKAIALAAKEEGVSITVEEAQRVIDTIFEMYPGLTTFFAECKERALNARWLCGCFGGMRRFPKARDFKNEGDFERQAMNFPIQGMIADAVSRAVDHLVTYRSTFDPDEFWFDIVLQVHDAILFEVDNRHAAFLVDNVLPYCMIDSVPIYPCYLDGRPKIDAAAPYHLGIDYEVCDHWGELLMPNQFLERDISPTYGGWDQHADGWRHKHKKHDHYWKDGSWLKIAM